MISADTHPVLVQNFLGNTLNHDYLIAARHGTVEDIRRALEQGADLLAYEAYGDERTDALLKAASSTHGPGAFAYLLEMGLDRVDRSHLEDTLLHRLIMQNYVDLLEVVLSRGHNVESLSTIGETPLARAVLSDNAKAVDALLRYGASVAVGASTGAPLLHRCSSAGIACALIEAGAQIEELNSNNETPLIAACRSGCVDVIDALLTAGADLDGKSVLRDGRTSLLTAAANGKGAALLLLLQRGADPSEQDAMGDDVSDLTASHPQARAAFESWRARESLRAVPTWPATHS